MPFDAVSFAMGRAALGTPFRIAALGDSIIQNHMDNGPGGDLTVMASCIEGWLHWAAGKDSRFFLDLAGNFGVGGNTTAQMLARVSSVIAYKPTLCFVQGGANDYSEITTTAGTTVGNLYEICRRLTAVGIKVVLIGVLPRDGAPSGVPTITRRIWRDQVNQRLMTIPDRLNSVVYVDPEPGLACTETSEDLLAANATASTVTLGASASSVDNFYANWTVNVRSSGTQELENKRTILSYVGSTKVATLEGTTWPVSQPGSGSRYFLLPDGLPARGVMKEAASNMAAGLHPGAIGAKILGARIVTCVGPLMPPRTFNRFSPGGVYDAADNPYGNLLANGLFQSDAGTSGGCFTGGSTATGWQSTGPQLTGTETMTREDRTDGGKWQVMTLSGITAGTSIAAYSVGLKANYGFALSAGWLMQLGMEADLTNLSGVKEVSVQATWMEADGVSKLLSGGRSRAFRENTVVNQYLPSGDIGRFQFLSPQRRVGALSAATVGFTFSILVYVDASLAAPASITAKFGNAWLRRVAEG